MEKVLGGADKIILDASPSGSSSTGVVPVLPLNDITRPQQRSPTQGSQSVTSGGTR
jgi:hypothetical protein